MARKLLIIFAVCVLWMAAIQATEEEDEPAFEILSDGEEEFNDELDNGIQNDDGIDEVVNDEGLSKIFKRPGELKVLIATAAKHLHAFNRTLAALRIARQV